jgi:hypothetical protein
MVKYRTLRRRARGERGATLFVVVLAITLLTGIGLYTVHSTGLVAQASGNGRQSLQTAHLAQLGALTTMSKLVEVPGTLANAQREWRKTNQTAEQCSSTQGVNVSTAGAPFCLELRSDATDFPLAGNVPLVAPDSFGMAIDPDTSAAPITGVFHTETTEVDQAGPVAGSSVGSVSSGPRTYYVQAKITAIGQLLPAAAFGSGACVQNVMQVSGQHITRAHVIVGPISQ